MLNSMWKKSWRDLWQRKGRTTLALLAIACSTWVLGTILVSFHYLSRDMNRGFLSANPHHLSVGVDGVSEALLEALRQRPGVAFAEARYLRSGRIRNRQGDWKQLQLFGALDWSRVAIDAKHAETGVWPPKQGEIAIERQARTVLAGEIGDTVALEIDQTIFEEFAVQGLVHDVVRAQAEWENIVYAYADLASLRAKGITEDVNRLLLVFNDVENRDDVIRQWEMVKPLLEEQGAVVGNVSIPTPGRHPHDVFNRQMYMILKAAGWTCSFFGSLLLVNLIAMSLAAEKRQIGVMKAIGGKWFQVARIYGGSVFLLALIGTLLGLLPVIPTARMLAKVMADLLNINLTSFGFPLWIPLALIGAGVVMPLFISFWPIRAASRKTIRESLVDYGVDHRAYRSSWLDRLLTNHVPAAIAMALRGVFRRRSRLVLNLAVLTGAGAFMMTFFNYDAIIDNYLDRSKQDNQWDLFMVLSKPTDVDAIQTLSELEQVALTEPQFRVRGEVEGLVNENVVITGLFTDSRMFNFTYASGRWLQGKNEVVINQSLRDALPPGVNTLTVRSVLGEHNLRIAGVAIILGGPRLFVSADLFFDSDITTTNRILVQAEDAFEKAEAQVSETLKQAGNQPTFVTTVQGNIQGLVDHFEIIVKIILALTILLGFIAINGIFSSMSMSLMERTREIGILRAIGCSRANLIRLLTLESGFLGLLAWLLGLILSLPLSQLAAYQSGQIFFKSPMAFDISTTGFIIALFALPAISTLASLLPAWRAANRPIRNSLVYE